MPSPVAKLKGSDSPGKPGRRPRTSHEEIVEHAKSILVREGAHALTFRAVAREAKIAVGAFSRYFKSLGELEDAVAADIVAKVHAIDATDLHELRAQLLRVSLEWLETTRTFPALANYHGPASAVAIAEHMGQAMKSMTAIGIDFDRAMMIYGMVVNLAFGWGLQLSRQADKKLRKQALKAFTDRFGELVPITAGLLDAPGDTNVYHRSFAMLIDGLLPNHNLPARKRR